MPFIWNDEEANFVDDTADFDRNEFVVVRKLFVQFKGDAEDAAESWIEQKFRIYGEIERIELFRGESSAAWAYVTFSKDKDAYSAFSDAPQLKVSTEIEKIVPADTWCQPSQLESTADNTVSEEMKQLQDEILKLNICDAAGIDSSNLLRQILSFNSQPWKESMEYQIEQLAEKFTFVMVDSRYAPNMSLREARAILRTIGPYVCDLCVNFRDAKWPRNVHRFYQKMCQYVGPNLKILRLVYVPNDENWLNQLKTLLCRIETLYVTMTNYDFDFDIDFQSYCPNLKTLKLHANLKGELLAKAWPKLERFSNRDNQYMEERLVLEFMKNNPQLKYFKVYANDCDNFLQQIPEHLHNLEELCLYQAYPSLSGDNVIHLAEMKQLKSLKLMYLEEEEFDGIVACLPKFKQLKELKLHTWYDGNDTVDIEDLFEPNLDAIVNLSQELHELECFHIRYCQINAVMLYDFIRNAKNLKSIRIYRCGLEVTDEILENIDSIRLAINPTKLLFYADNISSELNKENIHRCVDLIEK